MSTLFFFGLEIIKSSIGALFYNFLSLLLLGNNVTNNLYFLSYIENLLEIGYPLKNLSCPNKTVQSEHFSRLFRQQQKRRIFSSFFRRPLSIYCSDLPFLTLKAFLPFYNPKWAICPDKKTVRGFERVSERGIYLERGHVSWFLCNPQDPSFLWNFTWLFAACSSSIKIDHIRWEVRQDFRCDHWMPLC